MRSLMLSASCMLLSACATATGCYTLPTTEERVACLNAEAAYHAARHADFRAASDAADRGLQQVLNTQLLFNNISNRGR